MLITLLAAVLENEDVFTDEIDNGSLVVSDSVFEVCQSLVAQGRLEKALHCFDFLS